jgi:hypothetical protein
MARASTRAGSPLPSLPAGRDGIFISARGRPDRRAS